MTEEQQDRDSASSSTRKQNEFVTFELYNKLYNFVVIFSIEAQISGILGVIFNKKKCSKLYTLLVGKWLLNLMNNWEKLISRNLNQTRWLLKYVIWH